MKNHLINIRDIFIINIYIYISHRKNKYIKVEYPSI